MKHVGMHVTHIKMQIQRITQIKSNNRIYIYLLHLSLSLYIYIKIKFSIFFENGSLDPTWVLEVHGSKFGAGKNWIHWFSHGHLGNGQFAHHAIH
jgi:hypothetical protein